MTDYLKPPIGVSPEWYVIPRRIKELSEALVRYSEFYEQCHNIIRNEEEIFKLMRSWALELAMLCEVHNENRKIYRED